MTTTDIYLLDYGAGNVRSLVNAVQQLGYTLKYVEKPEDISKAQKLLFPGVGSVGCAMEKLNQLGYMEPLKAYLASGRPFMGICVGMQSLCLGSEESPGVAGLGLIPAMVKRFSATKSIPHMGWNSATPILETSMRLVRPETKYYFVHSYGLICSREDDWMRDWALTLTTYKDETFVSSICRGNIFATQFHPEKSGYVGLSVLKAFLQCDQPTLSKEPRTVTMQWPPCQFTVRIIACLDVRTNDQGDLVVTKGDQYDVREKTGEIRNLGKPVQLAKRYFEQGADEVTFLNITSFRNVPVHDLPMLQVLQRTSECVFVPLTIGGGIRDIEYTDPTTHETVHVSALKVAGEYFRSGADKVSIGSDAVYATEAYLKNNKKCLGNTAIEQISQVYGAQAVVISVDPRRVYVQDPQEAPHHTVIPTKTPGPQGEMYCWYQCTVKGGREGRDIDVIQLVTACEAMGAGEILLNCMDKDGTHSGYDLELIQSVKQNVSIPVIASSGAGCVEHFSQVFQETHVEAALAAGIFHREQVSIASVKEHLKRDVKMNIRPADDALE